MQVGVFVPPWGRTAVPGEVETVAEVAERLGYPSLWTGDHVVFPRSVSSRYPYKDSGVSPFDPDEPLLDPLSLIAYLAGRTRQINLGISVLVLPMRNPVETAKVLADIQVLSRGRLVLGVGVGWMREEFEALGAEFSGRGARTDEYLALLHHLWAGNSEPFEGAHVRLPALGFQPKPDPIPVVVGGNSEVAMQRAVRFDGWHAIRMDPERLRPKVALVREMVAAAGREPADFRIVYRGGLIAPDRLTAGPPERDDGVRAEANRVLESYGSAGVDELIVEFPDVPTGLRISWMSWVAEEVVGLSPSGHGDAGRSSLPGPPP